MPYKFLGWTIIPHHRHSIIGNFSEPSSEKNLDENAMMPHYGFLISSSHCGLTTGCMFQTPVRSNWCHTDSYWLIDYVTCQNKHEERGNVHFRSFAHELRWKTTWMNIRTRTDIAQPTARRHLLLPPSEVNCQQKRRNMFS